MSPDTLDVSLYCNKNQNLFKNIPKIIQVIINTMFYKLSVIQEVNVEKGIF